MEADGPTRPLARTRLTLWTGAAEDAAWVRDQFAKLLSDMIWVHCEDHPHIRARRRAHHLLGGANHADGGISGETIVSLMVGARPMVDQATCTLRRTAANFVAGRKPLKYGAGPLTCHTATWTSPGSHGFRRAEAARHCSAHSLATGYASALSSRALRNRQHLIPTSRLRIPDTQDSKRQQT